MDYGLGGKVALITGAAQGQGACEARRLADAGATVIIADIDEARARETQAEIAGAQILPLDVSREADWLAAKRFVGDRLGGLDILVNNAALLSYGTIEETSLATLQRMNAVNVEGVFLGMKHMLDCFRDGGSIINIASVAGMMGRPGQIAYLMGKWAIRGLGKAAAREFADRRVRVNTILPGLIATRMSEDHYGTDEVARMGEALPVGRAGRPNDIAEMVLFLASARSGFITGAEFVCDGGGTAGMA